MRRNLIAIDERVVFDDRLSDAECRLLLKIIPTYGTKMFNADQTTFDKLQTSKSAFYRLCANLIKHQYLQHNPNSSQYSVLVSIVGFACPGSETDIPTSETAQSHKRELKEREKAEEQENEEKKRTKRKEEKQKEDEKEKDKSINTISDLQADNLTTVTIETPKIKKSFQKPSLEEIKAYCRERKSTVSASAFFDWYEAKGWLVGKTPMKDWKAAVRTWEQKDRERGKFSIPRENQITEEEANNDCPF